MLATVRVPRAVVYSRRRPRHGNGRFPVRVAGWLYNFGLSSIAESDDVKNRAFSILAGITFPIG